MAFNQISEKNGVKIFLVDFDPQETGESQNFREASSLTILLEDFLNNKSPKPRTCEEGELSRSLERFTADMPRSEAFILSTYPMSKRIGRVQAFPWQQGLAELGL